MYATAATHLPQSIATVCEAVLAGGVAPAAWFPELRRLDRRRFDQVGARSELALALPGWPRHVPVTTTHVVRTTATARGRTPDGRDVALHLSLSPWDGGTAVVLSVDAGDRGDPVRSWSLSRRLELALVRLAGELAASWSAAGSTRP